jgi:hypothetical protein
MANTYRLVNPHIEGNIKTTIKSNNSVKAAKTFYKSLSQHFNNNIPKFYFTVQKGGSGTGKYYHFVVKELKDNNEVKFNIEPYVVSQDANTIKKFESKLSSFKSKFTQFGGKKPSKKNSKKSSKKSSKRLDDEYDSDLDSDENFYKIANTYRPSVVPPLYYWWYDPGVYNLSSVFIPTFYSYVTPYLQISLPNN